MGEFCFGAVSDIRALGTAPWRRGRCFGDNGVTLGGNEFYFSFFLVQMDEVVALTTRIAIKLCEMKSI